MTTAAGHVDSPPPAPRKRRIPWQKRLLFIGMGLLILAGFLELACYVGLKCVSYMTVAEVRTIREEDAQSEYGEQTEAAEVPHPYIGWTRNPRTHKPEFFEGREYNPNEYGLMDDASPIRKRSPEKIIVAVSGGSVGWQMAATGPDAFLENLKRQPRFQGKKIEIVRLTVSGFKQPQQLMLLTFLLSLGAEFDVLVNIDGYNESVLHPAENAVGGIFPPYPRAWLSRHASTLLTQDIQIKARLFESMTRRHARSKWFCRLPFQNSATVNFLWLSLYQRSIRDELNSNMALLDARHESPGYQLIGPRISFGSDSEMFDYLVNYWAQCSRQMNLICRANGIEFHQVLPPNQHLAGSKPHMDEREKTIAYLPSRYLEPARTAYPLLVEKGKELRAEGLNYHDLTQLFSTVAAPIYVDGCCHYNPTGNERLAAAVAEAIASTAPNAAAHR